jgi:hypothetical protein
MKKVIFSLLLVALIGISKVDAQQYFTYDGEVFSVLFTCNNENTKVTAVEFSSNGNWVPFKLTGNTDLEGTKEGGFIFYCVDGKGDNYAVDYYRDGDYIIVHSCDARHNLTGTDWTLERREE